MNREEVTLLGFEIVAYAGDARSKLLEALKAAEAGDFDKADALVEEANACIADNTAVAVTLIPSLSQSLIASNPSFVTGIFIKNVSPKYAFSVLASSNIFCAEFSVV